jgi:Uma2 family endonuclease
VETRPGRIRRPDVGVDCGERDPNAMKAAAPKVLIEVLSPSTRDFGSFGKLAEYKEIPSVDYVGLIEPNEPVVYLWTKGGDGAWIEQRIEGLDQAIEMTGLGVSLRMDAVYDGVQFPVGPRLIAG